MNYENCQNCSKLSHCNNNDLMCRSKAEEVILDDVSKMMAQKNTLLEEKDKEIARLNAVCFRIQEIVKTAMKSTVLTFPDFDLQTNAKIICGHFNHYLVEIIKQLGLFEVKDSENDEIKC